MAWNRRRTLFASAPSCNSAILATLLLLLVPARSSEVAAYPGPNERANKDDGSTELLIPATRDVAPNRERWTGSELAIGDRLRIVFYSRLGGSADADGTKVPNLSSLTERQDMAGEYVVQLDGTIFLPFLGKVSALGQSEADLLARLERKAAVTCPGTMKATIWIVEREPIYVTGDVPQPGAFKYSPGMMVVHAATLAGLRGIGPDGTDVGLRLTVLQQSERLRQSQLKTADLLAQRDVLVATRSGSTASPSEDLKSLVGGGMRRSGSPRRNASPTWRQPGCRTSRRRSPITW